MGKTVSNHPAIEVPVDELQAVAKWASHDADRPLLDMVVFANDYYVAADGHRAVRVPCKMGGRGTFGLTWRDIGIVVAAHREYVRHALKLDNRGRFLHLEVSNGPRTLTARLALGVSVSVPWYDIGTFPLDALDALLDKRSRGASPIGYHVNPQYLSDMAEVHAANTSGIADKDNYGVQLVSWSHDRLEALHFKNQNGVVFVIMPIRGSGK